MRRNEIWLNIFGFTLIKPYSRVDVPQIAATLVRKGSKISVRARLGVGSFPTLIFLHTQTHTHTKRIHSRMRFFITGNPK